MIEMESQLREDSNGMHGGGGGPRETEGGREREKGREGGREGGGGRGREGEGGSERMSE